MSSIPHTFAYRAQSIDGQPLTGTIDAASPDQARERLESLRLRVLELAPSAAKTSSPLTSNSPTSPPPACPSSRASA